MAERTGKRRLYIDETIWIALSQDGEMRQAIRLALKRHIQDDWLLLTSAFALDRMLGLEKDPATFLEYLQIIRRICSEIESLQVEDMERASFEILRHQTGLTEGLHLTLIKRMRCDGLLTMSDTLASVVGGGTRSGIGLSVFHPAG